MFELFASVEERDKTRAIKTIIDSASPRRDFFLLVSLSVAMASFAILVDSVVVLIGSMLIAPILYPILSFALSISTVDEKLAAQSGFTILKASVFSIVTATIIGLLFSANNISGLSVVDHIAYNGPSLIYAIIASISGFAAAFALAKPNLSEMLPGVAISVSLVPPLAVIGLALAAADISLAINALLLYLVNVCGILLSVVFVFVMLKIPQKQSVVTNAVKKNEEEIAEERGE